MPTLKRSGWSVGRTGLFGILRGDNPSVSPIVVDETEEFSIQGIVTYPVGRLL